MHAGHVHVASRRTGAAGAVVAEAGEDPPSLVVPGTAVGGTLGSTISTLAAPAPTGFAAARVSFSARTDGREGRPLRRRGRWDALGSACASDADGPAAGMAVGAGGGGGGGTSAGTGAEARTSMRPRRMRSWYRARFEDHIPVSKRAATLAARSGSTFRFSYREDGKRSPLEQLSPPLRSTMIAVSGKRCPVLPRESSEAR